MECGACAKNCPMSAINVDANVGCAAAIILGWLTGKEPTCGCGTGRDVYIASKLAGETGYAIGVDMTTEQIEIAQKYRI